MYKHGKIHDPATEEHLGRLNHRPTYDELMWLVVELAIRQRLVPQRLAFELLLGFVLGIGVGLMF